MAIGGQELLAYACRKFEEKEYEAALEAFILSYSRGYEQEWVIETIYQCYVAGNEAEYRNAFAQAAGGSEWSYEACTLDFIPLREGEYYIFDRELMAFRGLFSMHELEETKPDTEFREMAFSGAAIVMDWNWKEEQSTLIAAKDRKVYAICSDLNRASSFFKIPELKDYWKNVRLFADVGQFQDYFHQHTAEYLPRILCGKESSLSTVAAVLKEEHEYRLTPEGRNTDHILLTIAIPSYNRGNLLLKRLENLLSMPYDAEIEIAISKNGMELHQEEYEQASRIPDARIHYVPYTQTPALPAVLNWHRSVEISHGKYVVFVSDEDDIIIDALEHYLKLLMQNPQLNQIRAKTVVQYESITDAYGKKGIQAFDLMYLTQNYLSGLIVKREDFLAANLKELNQYKDNAFYVAYPHAWWCAILSTSGDAMQDTVVLVTEGDSVLKEEVNEYIKRGFPGAENTFVQNSTFPHYSTYEARLEQFQGMVEFLHMLASEHEELVELGLMSSIQKTVYLLELARGRHYDCQNYENMINKLQWLCMNAIDEFQFTELQKFNLLQTVLFYSLHALQKYQGLEEESAGE